jgi:hypothetical protein
MTALPSNIQSAISDLIRASEDLGSLSTSYGWNAASSKVEKAEKALSEAILSALNERK